MSSSFDAGQEYAHLRQQYEAAGMNTARLTGNKAKDLRLMYQNLLIADLTPATKELSDRVVQLAEILKTPPKDPVISLAKKLEATSLSETSGTTIPPELIVLISSHQKTVPEIEGSLQELAIQFNATLNATHIKSAYTGNEIALLNDAVRRFIANKEETITLHRPELRPLLQNITSVTIHDMLPPLPESDVIAGRGDVKGPSADQEETIFQFIKTNCPNIRSLDLKGLWLDDRFLHRIVTLFPQLTSLSFGGHSQVSDAGLQHLASITHLTHLSLRGSFDITDAGVRHLSPLTNLTHLDLSWCEGINGRGLQHLSSLTALTHLNLTSQLVRSAAKAELRKALPNLEIIDDPERFSRS